MASTQGRRRAQGRTELDPASHIVDWIVRKRDGGVLEHAELEALVKGLLHGQITDYQMSAWLMAATLRGLDRSETVALTQVMFESGVQVRHEHVSAPIIDKHSTGGVGDKISLCLAPWVAACGVAVPMIAGRGLGHTGGTLDKLEAIPGYNTRLSIAQFRRVVKQVGVSIIGQTDELAPADRRIYALRDVTGTVESESLICASILSKKLAAGLEGLVLDVKVGRGAFMKRRTHAARLAQLLIDVGRQLGLPIRAVLTDMSTPIGRTIGNALETAEAIAVLHGTGPTDTTTLTRALALEMLQLAWPRTKPDKLEAQLDAALNSGRAAEKLEQMIAAQGGDARVVAEPERLPRAPKQVALLARGAGYVSDIDALALGQLSVALGAGRTRADLPIDPAVGIELLVHVGQWVEPGEPLLKLHVRASAAARTHLPAAERTITVSSTRPRTRSRILTRLA
jgi:pyrimidine-nucleoside phosphorylase